MTNDHTIHINWPTVGWVVALLALITTAFYGGFWWGGERVLDSERLKATNEIVFEIVRVADEPSELMMINAERTCRGVPERGQHDTTPFNDCVSKFLSQFGSTYLVNVVEGTYEKLGSGSVHAPRD